jgi:DNA-binding IclR family transcriptional regulator
VWAALTKNLGNQEICMAKTDQRGIQSIDVGGRLLAAMLHKTAPMMLKDLSAETGIASAQAHAYLSSFKRLDLVVQDQADGRYALGPLALHLGLSYIASFEPLRAARDAVHKIEVATGLMTILAIWSNNAPTAIEVRPGLERLNVSVQPGSVFPLTGSSIGFIFAAFMPQDVISSRMQAELAGTQVRGGQWHLQPKDFAARVLDAKTCGFASLAGQPMFGLNSLAAPVFGIDGEFVAAIMMFGHEDKLDLSCEGQLVRVIKTHTMHSAQVAKIG